MSTKMEEGRKFFGRFVGEKVAVQYEVAAVPGAFGASMFRMALENVFGGLWARPDLDPRSRSLITLGMVIALRLPDEIENHARGALAHGCSATELEEIALHCSAYVGYPAAGIALAAFRKVLTEHSDTKHPF
jgi:4-carboxymuconolactone decarboxylase